MEVRFVGNLILGVIVSSPTWADTIRLHCSEILYDKTLNKPYDVPQVFILQDFNTLRWDNKKVDLSVVTTTPEAIEATGKATAYMPLPTQIDQCVNAELGSELIKATIPGGDEADGGEIVSGQPVVTRCDAPEVLEPVEGVLERASAACRDAC